MEEIGVKMILVDNNDGFWDLNGFKRSQTVLIGYVTFAYSLIYAQVIHFLINSHFQLVQVLQESKVNCHEHTKILSGKVAS